MSDRKYTDVKQRLSEDIRIRYADEADMDIDVEEIIAILDALPRNVTVYGASKVLSTAAHILSRKNKELDTEKMRVEPDELLFGK